MAGVETAGTAHSMDIFISNRFEFGKNWERYSSVLNDERIFYAKKSLKEMLECKSLKGKRFLDIGSGSGLFSLAARSLGAATHSFDVDPQSVNCTAKMKKGYRPKDKEWMIEKGSILDKNYIKSVGHFDIVYAWGVLHHTGHMWNALGNAALPVKEGGVLFIAIYNDQGFKSRFWKMVKKTYCSGKFSKGIITAIFFPLFFFYGLLSDLIFLRNPIRRYTEYKVKRGMSLLYDWIDWLGGYPYEVAKPEDIIHFYKKRNFILKKKIIVKNFGCNQFIFKKRGHA